jgi:hypothetical protein
MNTVDLSGDPYAIEAQQLEQRRKLAELIATGAMQGGPVYSNKAGIARALTGLVAGMDQGAAERGQRDLAEKKQTARRDEMGKIFDAAQNPDRAQLARLLAQSSDPGLNQAGLGLLLKGPGKITWEDAGDKKIGVDEQGNIVKVLPKGVSPDTRYGKETVGADTRYGKETVSADARLTDERTRSEGAANRGVTVRGQDLTDARATENAQNQKAPAGYQWNGDRLEVIPGGPAANKPLTESQSNAVAFGMRAKEMNGVLGGMGSDFKPSLWDVKTSGGENTNWMASEKGQKYLNAADNFTTAVLRKESGATITPAEQDQARRVYIPMPGDAPAVLKQKAENRALAIKALDAQTGSTPRAAVSAR